MNKPFTRPKMRVYTDGSCLGNPGGPGGWGCVFVHEDSEGNPGLVYKTYSGSEVNSTNNRMEITAVLRALENIRTSWDVSIYSDSQYVLNVIRGDITPASNMDLWNRLHWTLEIMKDQTDFYWVKGHSGDIYNDMADALATNAAGDLKSWVLDSRADRRRRRKFGRKFLRHSRERDSTQS